MWREINSVVVLPNDAMGIADKMHSIQFKLTMIIMQEARNLSVEIENALRKKSALNDVEMPMKNLIIQLQQAVQEL